MGLSNSKARVFKKENKIEYIFSNAVDPDPYSKFTAELTIQFKTFFIWCVIIFK